jgi:hypothetical protein
MLAGKQLAQLSDLFRAGAWHAVCQNFPHCRLLFLIATKNNHSLFDTK